MKTRSEYQYILRWYKKIKGIELLGSKCCICNEDRPWLLEFHHIDPHEKLFRWDSLKGKKWSDIEKELNKCQLLCNNCHSEIHDSIDDSVYIQSKKILLDIKSVNGCEICGYNKNNGSLEFHHNSQSDKLFELGNIKIYENSCQQVKEKIIHEINKCSVYCSNCHHDLHFDKEKFNKYKNEIYRWNYVEQAPTVNRNKVIQMYQQGIKQKDIAQILGCSRATICIIVKRLNK